jgi:hypothetical protein
MASRMKWPLDRLTFIVSPAAPISAQAIWLYPNCALKRERSA